jgi:rare lipoprotein A (peptidoglycan hydrolase)
LPREGQPGGETVQPPPGRDSSGYVDPTPERLSSRDGQYHKGQTLQGVASVYWEGHQTANGSPFNPNDSQHITLAHKYLPFGTMLRLEANGRSVIAEVTDRGPFVRGREFDITPPAARALGINGLGQINATILHIGHGGYHKPGWYSAGNRSMYE